MENELGVRQVGGSGEGLTRGSGEGDNGGEITGDKGRGQSADGWGG
jgi:hypothetical protein